MRAINQYPQLKAADGSDNVNFTQAGSNVVTRTVQDKLQDFVSVKDFGAVGNGIADDTIAIQNALTAGSAAQCSVWLPAGTYKVSSRLIVPTRTGLVSDGSATIYATAAGFNNSDLAVKYTNNSAVIDLSGQLTAPFTPNEGQIVQGIRLISEVNDARFVDGIVARNCTNLRIVDNEIANFPVTRAICVASVLDGEISSNYIHDCTTNYTGWSPTRPQITAIEVDNDRVNSTYSANVLISGNRITDITVGPAVLAYAGFETDGINLAISTDISVVNNVIDNVGEGVDTFASRGLISNNVITNTYNFGIKMIHGASLNVVSGNRIYNTGIAGILISGSDIAGVGDTTKNLISGNTVENVDYLGVWAAGGGTGLAGIKIDGSTATFKPTNNLFEGNLLDGSSNYGIITGQVSNNNTYSNNRILASPALGWIGGNETLRVTDALRSNMRAYRSTTQSIPSMTWTKVQYNIENFDVRGEYDNSTNYRWTCQIPGAYRVKGTVRFVAGSIPAGTYVEIVIRKNNAVVSGFTAPASTLDQVLAVDDVVQCVQSDYLEIWYYQNHSSAQNVTGDPSVTFFSVSQA